MLLLVKRSIDEYKLSCTPYRTRYWENERLEHVNSGKDHGGLLPRRVWSRLDENNSADTGCWGNKLLSTKSSGENASR